MPQMGASSRSADVSARCALAILDPANASVRIIVPDHAGHFRVHASFGPKVTAGRLRSARRRQAFGSGRTARMRLGSPAGATLAIVPLLAGDRAMGLMEVCAPTQLLEERIGLLQDVAASAGATLHAEAEAREATRAVEAMEVVFDITVRLLRSERRVEAIGSAAELCSEFLDRPVAGLVPDRSGTGWYLAASCGIGQRRSAATRRAISKIPVHGRRRQILRELQRALADTGISGVEAADADPAVLLVVGSYRAHRPFMGAVASLLRDTLQHLESLELARARNEQLDLGIALTAHELKEPISAARLALDHAIASAGDDDTALLRRTRDELGRLAGVVRPLLDLSSGNGGLRRRRIDLARVVREAVADCLGGTRLHRVRVTGTTRLIVTADARQLRAAVANVVRNALAYSPPDSVVVVEVSDEPGVARVCVRDDGPGVPPAERDRVFDVFARGDAARATSSGHGLGLFIARRAMEAHGGTAQALASRRGSVFRLELPVAETRQRAQRSAS